MRPAASRAPPPTPRQAPGDVYSFRFCPSNPDIVVAGVASGQVIAWNLADARAQAAETKMITGDAQEEGGSNTIAAQPFVLSAIDQSHRRTITDIQWLPSWLDMSEKGKLTRKPDTGAEQQQFLTVSADGQVLFWDLQKALQAVADEQKTKDEKEKEKSRKEGWWPTHKVALTHPDSSVEPSCVHVIFDVPDDAEAACRLFSVTEEGEIISIDLSNPGTDSQRGVRSVIAGHHSPCCALQRSPHVPDVQLSVGDWSFHLWKEGVSSPLFSAPFASCLLTCGAWSPTRPAVVFIGKADGGIDVWDLLDRSHEPSMSVSITSAAVTSMQFHNQANKQLLAVGDDQGTVHVMEVPRNLRRMANAEKNFTSNFFEREEKRVEYVQQREEQRSADSAKKEAAARAGEGAADAKGEQADTSADDERLEAAFREVETQFKEDMGISDPSKPADGDGY